MCVTESLSAESVEMEVEVQGCKWKESTVHLVVITLSVTHDDRNVGPLD